ncbi:nucleotidyltransferase family protein [Kytococcus schroeteri]|uniref:nucleotidyltransferase family protein n=1 Tax=Kytococcus schroeteri TaxID=138300 RepID=UPI0022AAF469|nr:nucleotidyltransferase domain-containing protein [Kytococcus schroeteri]
MRRHAAEVKRLVAEHGGSQVRVLGSTAHGTDGPESDIDLLFLPSRTLGLMELVALERDISTILERPVDLVAEPALHPLVKDRVLAEAVPL